MKTTHEILIKLTQDIIEVERMTIGQIVHIIFPNKTYKIKCTRQIKSAGYRQFIITTGNETSQLYFQNEINELIVKWYMFHYEIKDFQW